MKYKSPCFSVCAHEPWREGGGEVDAVRLDQVEDARVAQPVVALGGVRELVEDDDLEVGVADEVLDRVVPTALTPLPDANTLPGLSVLSWGPAGAAPDEAATAGDDAPLARAKPGARPRNRREGSLRRRLRPAPHRADDALPLRRPDPPADGEAEDLLGEAVELRQPRRDRGDARVEVVALVDGGGGDAGLGSGLGVGFGVRGKG